MRVVFRGALLSLGPSAALVRVPALREGIGRFGGFMEPRPAGMSARSRLGLPGPPGPSPPPRRAARHPRPRHPVFLRVRFVVKTRPASSGPSSKGHFPSLGSRFLGLESGCARDQTRGSSPPSSPRPRDNPCLVLPSASRVFRGLGLRLFSRAESQAQLLLSAGSASPFPRIFPGSWNPGAQLSPGAGLGVA